MFRSLRLRATVALTATLLAVAGLASAQSAPTQPATPPATSSSPQQTLAQLQREALQLTLVARLPAADQQQATQLLDRAAALRQKALDLRRQELQAYVAALKSGTAPAAARAQAQQKVAGQRTSLAQEAATLRSDAQSFLQKVPQARALLGYLRAGAGNARGGSPAFGFGSRGPRAGGGFAPGYRGAPGMRFDGRGWDMGPGRMGRGAPGWNGPASRYGRFGEGMQGRMGRYGERSYRMGPNGARRGGFLPWSQPAAPNGAPQNGAPQNNAPQNNAPQNNAPQNGSPQNTTPPSGSGAGGA